MSRIGWKTLWLVAQTCSGTSLASDGEEGASLTETSSHKVEEFRKYCAIPMSSKLWAGDKNMRAGGLWGLSPAAEHGDAFPHRPDPPSASFRLHKMDPTTKEADATDMLATARYNRRTRHETLAPRPGDVTSGWADVYVQFQPREAIPAESPLNLPDHKRMYAAGLLEGALTAPEIKSFYVNTRSSISDEDRDQLSTHIFLPELLFLDRHRPSGHEHAEPESAFWRQSVAQACQLFGMLDGYHLARKHLYADEHFPDELDVADFMRLNADGQVDELKDRVVDVRPSSSHSKAWLSSSFLQQPGDDGGGGALRTTRGRGSGKDAWVKPGRCSALVRFTGDELYTAHTTWENYNEATRSIKRYQFPLRDSKDSCHTVLMSSYPGCITSTDDFVIGSNNVLITETTTNVQNENRHRWLQGRIPDYVHVMSAMRLSGDGKSFVDQFLNTAGHGKYALTGTYNSEWMVVDYNKFKKEEKKLDDGALYVIDTGPGASKFPRDALVSGESLKIDEPGLRGNSMLETDRVFKVNVNELMSKTGSAAFIDATPVLRSGQGYYSSFNEAQLSPIARLLGSDPESDPRRSIFAKEAPKAKTVSDIAWLMRRNEPELDGEPSGARPIAPRNDFRKFGGTDTKVVSAAHVKDLALLGISGPTAVVGGCCKPYRWRAPQDGIERVMDSGWRVFKKMDSAAPEEFLSQAWRDDAGNAIGACARPDLVSSGRASETSICGSSSDTYDG